MSYSAVLIGACNKKIEYCISGEVGMIREYIVNISSEVIENVFEERPQELVRCKDCKHATMTSDGKMCKYCAMDTDDFGDHRDVYHDADWFCADGERKSKDD